MAFCRLNTATVIEALLFYGSNFWLLRVPTGRDLLADLTVMHESNLYKVLNYHALRLPVNLQPSQPDKRVKNFPAQHVSLSTINHSYLWTFL